MDPTPPRPRPAPPPARVRATVATLPGGPAWLAELPALLERLCAEWGLRPDRPFDGGSCSWTAPVTTAEGGRAVIKVPFPHREARGEATGLRLWDGAGAVRLYRADEDSGALLIELCAPGDPLSDAGGRPEETLTAGAATLRSLWEHAPGERPGLERIDDVAAEWAPLLRERAHRHRGLLDGALAEHAAGLLETLPATAARRVVVHGDFNPGNVLRARRAPWLAIDPKPMSGDPCYDPWPLLMQIDPPMGAADPGRRLRSRLALVADVLGQPAERIAAWAFARSTESAYELLDRGLGDAAEEEITAARALARTAGV
ncbi:streptomycin 6-kinase [Marinactinospora thermotolerans DSM 45154]|uniref:Streptomycin 6-kinase n=1 Tax=Marinactinospora thermotolerans DSM 45154 TaxID=1122192 RepID=A0A1T4MVT5_9ACTN|nr:aminoglycoside phosphotransferase family protein [Marinactinospora thermotolerans]SJZ71021.1 streptomycin 6-kinase [Marinactinospora thermotolerans DSM 45154]